MVERIGIKRVYDPVGPHDGYRVLVDRLWPRGKSKADLHYDVWIKDLAPSAALRKWFGHKTENWDQFVERYRSELTTPDQVARLRKLVQDAGGNTITLIYSAKDAQHNQAVVLAQVLKRLY